MPSVCIQRRRRKTAHLYQSVLKETLERLREYRAELAVGRQGSHARGPHHGNRLPRPLSLIGKLLGVHDDERAGRRYEIEAKVLGDVARDPVVHDVYVAAGELSDLCKQFLVCEFSVENVGRAERLESVYIVRGCCRYDGREAGQSQELDRCRAVSDLYRTGKAEAYRLDRQR